MVPADDPHRYSLGTVPKRLRRRASLTGAVIVLPAGLALMALIGFLEGLRYSAGAWVVIALLIAVPVAAALISVRTLSAEDRHLMDQASARHIPTITPTAEQSTAIEVALSPGRYRRRRLEQWPEAWSIRADEVGLHVPGWLLDRTSDLPPHAVVTMAWSEISAVRVSSDSDGPDLIEVIAPGGKTRWRIARAWITDEVALLDHIRSIGQRPIDLRATITTR